MLKWINFLLLVLFIWQNNCRVEGFSLSVSLLQPQQKQMLKRLRPLKMDIELNTYTYGLIFIATLIPSIALVKFVGDQADTSRDKLSLSTRERFRRSLLEQGAGTNFANPTAEEDAIKRQIAKAYREDKDVDVAVLEEKLRERAKWRKELQAQMQSKVASGSNGNSTEDDGW